MEITVNVDEFAGALNLEILEKGRGTMQLSCSDTNRPGLQFAGYLDHFDYDRVQLIASAVMHYLYSLSSEVAYVRLGKFMSSGIPCVVCSRGDRPPVELMAAAKEYSVPVFLATEPTAQIASQIKQYLDMKFAPTATIHGVFLDVYGVGVLLSGDSGIGKSETALELVKQGHRLVADDAIEITVRPDGRLLGRSPALIKHLMEIRGVGLIDVRYLYGVGAVIDEKTVDLVVELEMWHEGDKYDRLSAGERYREYLDVKVPAVLIPVRPGRNLSTVVEVAARNFRLKLSGYDAAKEFRSKIGLDNHL